MKPIALRLFLMSLFLVVGLFAHTEVSCSEAAAEFTGKDYTIAAGDVLEISVWKNEELTRRLVVLPDGKIAFPLIGEIVVQGKTVGQLKMALDEKISHYVPNPELSVIVQEVNSMLVYVIGKVNGPGRFLLNSEIDVLQGLALAGGLNRFAERNKIKVFRKEGDQTRIFDFKYDKVSDGEELSQNVTLKRGDVIVVP